jgi:tyrosine-protein phosphatase YwqE
MQKISAKISKKRAAMITESNLMNFIMSDPVTKKRPENAKAKQAQKEKEAEINQSMTSGLEKLYNDKNGKSCCYIA